MLFPVGRNAFVFALDSALRLLTLMLEYLRRAYISLGIAAGQLSLAIPPQVGKMSTGDDYSHRQGRNGEFCVTVGPVPGLLTY